ncbi:BrnT family toxin [Nitrospira sp. M1]
MLFEWDEEKNRLNIEKHRISFEEAVHIFNDIHLSRPDTREDYGEVREITIGVIAETVVAVVVHTDRDEMIRLISARKANKRERSEYHAYYTKKTEGPAADLEEAD